MATVRELLVRITGDGADLEQALNRSARNLDALGRRFEGVGRDLSVKFTAPIVAAGAGVLALTHRAAAFADEIDKTSIRTGISREELQRLRFVADQTGVSFDGLSGVVESFTRRIPQLDKGTSDTARAFRALGIELRGSDGQLRGMAELFPDVIRGLSQVENVTTRNAIATQLFGRRAFEIVPILEAGGERVENLMRRADELGIVMGDQAIGDLVRYKDSMAEVREQLGATGREVALGFLPILQEQLIPFIQRAVVPRIREWTGVLRELEPATIRNVGATAALVAAIGPLLFAFGAAIRTGSTLLRTLTLLGASKAALGVLLMPGGVVIAGLTLMAGLFVRNQIEAARLAGETAALRAEIMGLSGDERALRMDRVREELAAAVREVNEASGAFARLRAESRRGLVDHEVVDAEGMTPGLREAEERFRRTQDNVAALSGELQMLEDAERRAGEETARLKGLLDDFDFSTSSATDKVRTAGDVLADLATQLRIASELGALSDEFDENALAISAMSGALRELVTMEERSEEAVEVVAAALRERRAEMSATSEERQRQAQEESEALRALNQAQAEYNRLLAEAMTPAEQFVATARQLFLLFDAKRISAEELNTVLALARERFDELDGAVEGSAGTWQTQWAQSVVAATGRVSLSFRSMAQDIIAQIARITSRLLFMRAMMSLLAPFAGGGGVGGALFSAFASPFGGARARGGPVQAGRTYLVGERGPELFQPSGSGRVVPNFALAGAGDSGTGPSAIAVAEAVMSQVRPPAHAPPEVAATYDYHRRLFSYLKENYDDRGGR